MDRSYELRLELIAQQLPSLPTSPTETNTMMIVLTGFGTMDAVRAPNVPTLEVTRVVRVIVVLVAVLVITFPFGFYRAYTRKWSWRWFLAIHLPVPLVFLARFESHLSYAFIPFTCIAFTAGQLLGAKTGRWWMRRRSIATATDEPKDSQQTTRSGPGPRVSESPVALKVSSPASCPPRSEEARLSDTA